MTKFLAVMDATMTAAAAALMVFTALFVALCVIDYAHSILTSSKRVIGKVTAA